MFCFLGLNVPYIGTVGQISRIRKSAKLLKCELKYLHDGDCKLYLVSSCNVTSVCFRCNVESSIVPNKNIYEPLLVVFVVDSLSGDPRPSVAAVSLDARVHHTALLQKFRPLLEASGARNSQKKKSTRCGYVVDSLSAMPQSISTALDLLAKACSE